ncbi:DNA cytosine methyltransferase [Nostoc sp. FACHB-892]|uniref:DNA cytosine methyltransferase n=1 Tax=Nostoc sp. FACHB-892 TaxID=2692843 RepID=UPI001684AFEA|nr:DNA cytosine methyltransferase [Nostoc sp. FACHB-892]MBD2724757.1 DNA cytosine methyltransferase [Nostoc sp. FACHB-892]
MQQLSLFSDVSSSEPTNTNWFQNILTILAVRQEPAWTDNFGKSLRQWLIQQGHTPIKTLSLFSGGGGLDIGFHDAGFEIIQMVELEAKYVQTLKINSLPDKWLEGSEPICIDIRKYLPEPHLTVDFIIGGPPCQTFSAAGRRAAGVSGTTDVRGTLFQEYVRILNLLKPKGFLFENVYGITGANGGEAWQEMEIHPAVKKAGFVTSLEAERIDELVPRCHEIEEIFGISLEILTFEEWVELQFSRTLTEEVATEQELASAWLIAYTESLAQQRREIAPIDEPCYQWLLKLNETLIK